MMPGEDFNDRAQRIVFKHDPDIAELVFNYCNRSRKLFPEEVLEGKVDAIKSSRVHSRLALSNTITEYYQDVPQDVIDGYVEELRITFQSESAVTFTEEEYEAFDKRWDKEKEHFFDPVIVMISEAVPEMDA